MKQLVLPVIAVQNVTPDAAGTPTSRFTPFSKDVRPVGDRGSSAALDFRRTYSDCAASFDNAREQRIRTRLGDETVRIELDRAVHCWYATPATPVCSVDLPAWALPGGTEPAAREAHVAAVTDDGGTSFKLGSRLYRYAPAGWEWQDECTRSC